MSQHFKSGTDIAPLQKFCKGCLSEFGIMSLPSNSCVLKTEAYLKEENIPYIMIDGTIIESYLDPNANMKFNYFRMNELLDSTLKCYDKFVLIKNLRNKWSPTLSVYFCERLKNAYALGLIFYSEGYDNLAEELITKTDTNVIQFLKKRYNERIIEDDEY